jgi:hypothetical protein
MGPVAKANRKIALTYVPLKVVSDELRSRAGESEAGVVEFTKRQIFRNRFRHRGSGAPPPNFCRDRGCHVVIEGSDVVDVWGDCGYAHRLRGVSLPWEDVLAEYPELGPELPKLGVYRVEVSFAASLMKWFEKLVARLWRKSPSLKPATRIDTEEFDTEEWPTADALGLALQAVKQRRLLAQLPDLMERFPERYNMAKLRSGDIAAKKLAYDAGDMDRDAATLLLKKLQAWFDHRL